MQAVEHHDAEFAHDSFRNIQPDSAALISTFSCMHTSVSIKVYRFYLFHYSLSLILLKNKSKNLLQTYVHSHLKLVAWRIGRTLVFDRGTFPVLRSTSS